jgi:RHS repeat-associated protein
MLNSLIVLLYYFKLILLQNTSGPYLSQGPYLCWTYDAFGNRTTESLSATPCSSSPAPTTWANYNSSNRVTGTTQAVAGYSYDAAGNVLNDGQNQYAYDGEGRLCAVYNGLFGSYTQYIYDADGNRVAKGSINSLSCDTSTNGFTLLTQYVVGQSGEQVSELDGSGNWRHSNVYSGGQVLGTYDASGFHFNLTDPLGTKRMQVLADLSAYEQCESLPFGNSLNCYGPASYTDSGTDDEATEHHFTGKERDQESGLDYFGARYYSSNMGRFLSPDWSAKQEPVPYAKLDNPQSLNLYAYVGNNPLSRRDPDGHADIAAQCQGKPTCTMTLTQTVNIVHQQTDKATGETKTVVDSTLKVTTNFSVTTDAKGNMSATASSTVSNVSGIKFSDSQLATMGRDIGTMQQAAVGMGFGANTTQLVTAVGAAESHFGASPPYNGAPNYMNPAINPMQLTGGNGANMDLNHNVEGGMGILDWAGRPSTFDPTATYTRYSDHSPATMANWNAIYGSINETQP